MKLSDNAQDTTLLVIMWDYDEQYRQVTVGSMPLLKLHIPSIGSKFVPQVSPVLRPCIPFEPEALYTRPAQLASRVVLLKVAILLVLKTNRTSPIASGAMLTISPSIGKRRVTVGAFLAPNELHLTTDDVFYSSRLCVYLRLLSEVLDE